MPTLVAIDSSSGYFDKEASSYVEAHDPAEGDNAYNGVSNIYIGQYYKSFPTVYYLVNRGGMTFDTSIIPAGASIISALLVLKARQLSGATFTLHLVSGADLGETFVVADFGDLLDEITSFGSVAISQPSQGDELTITLNDDGLTAITKAGTTRFGLRSANDINKVAPTGSTEEGLLSGSGRAGEEPVLTIIYSQFPSDALARVSSIRHILRPGFFRMQVGLGDLGLDIDIAEATVRKALDTAKEAEEAPSVAGVGYPEILKTLGMTAEEFAEMGRKLAIGRHLEFPAYEEQIAYEDWFQKQMDILKEMQQ